LGFALLCDISQHTNDLNTKLQGQEKLISGKFGAVSFLNEAETILEMGRKY
jgi:hypothetical protein